MLLWSISIRVSHNITAKLFELCFDHDSQRILTSYTPLFGIESALKLCALSHWRVARRR